MSFLYCIRRYAVLQSQFEKRNIKAKFNIVKVKSKRKTYEYPHHSIQLMVYLRKGVVEKYGEDYEVVIDRESGAVVIKPLSMKCSDFLKRVKYMLSRFNCEDGNPMPRGDLLDWVKQSPGNP